MPDGREELIQLAMELVGLNREQAVEYLMERQYNQCGHLQALEAIRAKSWLWPQEGN